MAALPKDIDAQVQDLIEKGGLQFRKGEVPQSIRSFQDAWNLLPAPPEKYDDSYHLATYLVHIHSAQKDYEAAAKWADTLQKCDPERIDDGEREFIAGKVAFESGDKVTAKRFFTTAFKKSEGRSFDGEDPQYLDLLMD